MLSSRVFDCSQFYSRNGIAVESVSGSFANLMTSAPLSEAERAAWNKSSCARVTVVLSLALAMSIPRKPEQQSRADTLVPVAEHYLQ
jgi:hypothetical protein